MTEAPRLITVAVDLDRVTGKRSLDEPRYHHAVLAALPRADSVEEANDDAVELAFVVIREGEELVHRLGIRI